jgi:hypothetical protein
MLSTPGKITWLVLGFGLLAISCEKRMVDVDLTANDWKVEKIRASEQKAYVTTDSLYILQLKGDGSCFLNLDVNTCGSYYEVPSAGSIKFQMVACTEICCDTEFAANLRALFSKMNSYYVRKDRLHLEGEGEIVLLIHEP